MATVSREDLLAQLRNRQVVLTGNVIRLEPLTVQHATDLLEAGSIEYDRTFAVTYKPYPRTVEGFETYIRFLHSLPDLTPLAMILLETGKAIGVTTYMEMALAHRNLEIGYTWISAAHQGTKVNPEAKYLMLRHAFENLGLVRVQFKTDARNTQSQRALEKLGAKKEGVLRKQRILQDGFIRDSVVYSILDTEWPDVKAALEKRLSS